MDPDKFLEAIDELAAEHRADLEFLRQLPPDEPVTCRICRGLDSLGRCPGEQTARDAIDFIEGELEILLHK